MQGHPAPAGRLGSAGLPLQTKFFYGWVVVATSALAIFFSGPGQSFAVAVFINTYIAYFHMSRAAVSATYSLATLIAGALLFVVGRLVDRYGPRTTMLGAAVLFGLALLGNSFIVGPLTMFFGFFLLRFLGLGSLNLIPNTLVPQWFVRQRGRALSMMAIGGLLAAAVIPPANNLMIHAWGWQAAWRVWGVMLLCVFAPVAGLLIRNRPEDVGLAPDGFGAGKAVQHEPAAREADWDEISWTLGEVMRTRAFWLILFCVIVPAVVNTGITFQLFSILAGRGIGEAAIALVLSLYALIAFVSTLATGFLLERWPVHRLMSAAFVLSTVQIAILLFARSPAMVLAFVVLWGLSQGLLNVSFNFIWPHYFGRRHLGSINSIMLTVMIAGAAVGPVAFGWAFDRFGGYQQILTAVLLLPAAGSLLALLAGRPAARLEVQATSPRSGG